LQLITNDSQQHKAALEGLEKITDLIDLYAGVEDEYLGRDEFSPLQTKFAEKLEILYFEILEYLAKAACHFDRDTVQRMLRNIPKIDDWDGQVQKIMSSDEACRRFANKFDSQDQRMGTKTIKILLEEQGRKTTELLQEFGRRYDQNAEVISWVSPVEARNGHDQVREKLGSHYQNSGQWLRPKYEKWIASPDKPTFWLCGSGS
jgi:hypothetical protein